MEQKKKLWGVFLPPLTWGRLWSDSFGEGEAEEPRSIKNSFTLCPSASLLSFASYTPLLSPARKKKKKKTLLSLKPDPPPDLGER